MPIHDWTRVEAGIFHHFHLEWVGDLSRMMNRGVLPSGYYALAEQFAGGFGPDVLTLHRSIPPAPLPEVIPGAIALAEAPPKVRVRARAEFDYYVEKARTIVIRHVTNHQVVAMCEIVSPGNKSSHKAFQALLEKAVSVIRSGIHLVVIDLFPPGPRDPQGIHKAIWDEFVDNDFCLPDDRPLTLASYIGGRIPEAFVEPASVGEALPDMPLFLSPEIYIPLPLERSYQSAWEAVPDYWSEVLSAPPYPSNGRSKAE